MGNAGVNREQRRALTVSLIGGSMLLASLGILPLSYVTFISGLFVGFGGAPSN